MGACGSKPQTYITADPPSVYDLDKEKVKAAEQHQALVQAQHQAESAGPVDPNASEALVERVLQLELENARLREHLQLLAGAQACKCQAWPTGNCTWATLSASLYFYSNSPNFHAVSSYH